MSMTNAPSGAAATHSDPSVDQAQSAGEAPQVRLEIPLITTADESSFDDVVATSRAVPVVIVLWGSRSLESRPVLEAMEDLTREKAGAFQLVEIDAEASQAIARAFQIQALPTVVALVGGRPVPLFQGNAAKEQIRPLLDELVQAAAQLGVKAAVAVDEADTAEPTPEEHLPALAAEEAGDLAGALAAWEKLVDLNPRDEKAKAQLARVRLIVRSLTPLDEGEAEDPQVLADALFGAGRVKEAFDILLDLLATTRDAEVRDAVRLRLLDLFRVAGGGEEVKAARKRLTTLLMV